MYSIIYYYYYHDGHSQQVQLLNLLYILSNINLKQSDYYYYYKCILFFHHLLLLFLLCLSSSIFLLRCCHHGNCLRRCSQGFHKRKCFATRFSPSFRRLDIALYICSKLRTRARRTRVIQKRLRVQGVLLIYPLGLTPL